MWRAELDRLGVWVVQKKLEQAGVGHGALVHGFACGPIERIFIEAWLSRKERAAARQQEVTLGWARTAAWASIASLVVSILLCVADVRNALRTITTVLGGWLEWR